VTGAGIIIREDEMMTNVLLYGVLIAVAVLYFMRREKNRKSSKKS
jgi:hypothetical protein